MDAILDNPETENSGTVDGASGSDVSVEEPMPGEGTEEAVILAGQDLSYEPAYSILEEAMRGTAAQFVGRECVREAQEPDWTVIADDVSKMLERSNDLYLLVIYTTASLASEGLAGAAKGFARLRRSIAQDWQNMWPELDMDESPQERYVAHRNLLQNLCNPVFSPDDPYHFLQRLSRAPLCASPRIGAFSMEQIQAAESGEPGAPGMGEIEAAFQDTPLPLLKTNLEAAKEALENVKVIIARCQEVIGIELAPSLNPLQNALSDAVKLLQRFMPNPAMGEGNDAATGGELPDNGQNARASKIETVTIHSRNEATVALDKIIEYYRSHEPASPVPLLLQRARRLIDSDFLSIVEDLHPDALSQIQLIIQGKNKD